MKEVKAETSLVYKDKNIIRNQVIVGIIAIIYVICTAISMAIHIDMLHIIYIAIYNLIILCALVVCMYLMHKKYRYGVVQELLIGLCSALIALLVLFLYKELLIYVILQLMVDALLLVHSIIQLVRIIKRNKYAR